VNHRPSRLPRLRVTREAWLRIGGELFGENPREWRFQCPSCGHIQSEREARERNAEVKNLSDWIYFSCEGRHTPSVGCDWTLGGLFQIHTLEVVSDGGHVSRVMRFAHERADELLTAAAKEVA
jgi:hypothetical protein